jgi:hypothetical protein
MSTLSQFWIDVLTCPGSDLLAARGFDTFTAESGSVHVEDFVQCKFPGGHVRPLQCSK